LQRERRNDRAAVRLEHAGIAVVGTGVLVIGRLASGLLV
jgi:hypothetical protein